MISFVYFDVGGVITKDFSNSNKWKRLQSELGIDSHYSEAFIRLFLEKEREICTTLPIEKLVPILRKDFGVKVSTAHPLLESFLKRFEKNSSIWPVVRKVKEQAEVGLLTNMYVGMLDELIRQHLIPNIEWDAVIDSSTCGYIKPDKEIFQLAEEEATVLGNEILFVDNSKGHIEVARELGWQTFFYDSSDYKDSSDKLLKFFKENV